jgi:3,4-dihydroxy 2-butanone 4-phosphate synthase/GTP cyclohydrolase II
MELSSVEELVQDIRLGKMIVLLDDDDKENEGNLIIASECVKPDDISFMATQARGLICMTLTEARCQQLDLPLMVDGSHGSQFNSKFTLSIEATVGVTTGISAADRAQTVLAAVAHDATPASLVQPGHIFPIMAQPGGVLSRAGHTEAGCDLAGLAGFEPSATIVDILNDDGSMARRADLEKFAEKHELKMGTISDLIHYRIINERTIEKINQVVVDTDYGEFTLHSYKDLLNDAIHHALVKGDVTGGNPVLTRIGFLSTLRDLFNVQPFESKSWNIQRCLKRVEEEGKGVVVLLSHNETEAEILSSLEIAGGNKEPPIKGVGKAAYMTVGLGSQIVRDVGVKKMRMMSPEVKYNALSGFDLEVIEFLEP